MFINLHIPYGCFYATRTDLSRCGRDSMACKAENIYHLDLDQRNLMSLTRMLWCFPMSWILVSRASHAQWFPFRLAEIIYSLSILRPFPSQDLCTDVPSVKDAVTKNFSCCLFSSLSSQLTDSYQRGLLTLLHPSSLHPSYILFRPSIHQYLMSAIVMLCVFHLYTWFVWFFSGSLGPQKVTGPSKHSMNPCGLGELMNERVNESVLE